MTARPGEGAPEWVLYDLGRLRGAAERRAGLYAGRDPHLPDMRELAAGQREVAEVYAFLIRHLPALLDARSRGQRVVDLGAPPRPVVDATAVCGQPLTVDRTLGGSS